MSDATSVAIDPNDSGCLVVQGLSWACGSHSTYNNHGCRGDACRADNVRFNKSQRESRHQRMLSGEVTPEHGKESTYFNYKCRCDECKEEHRRRAAERRRTRSEVETEIVISTP